nr:MAG TPA: hypothetical protein [Caudoviricetes sp.]
MTGRKDGQKKAPRLGAGWWKFDLKKRFHYER